MKSLLGSNHDRYTNRLGQKRTSSWSFFNPELLDEEKELLFRSHWQMICHVNDVPNAGDYMTSDIVGERALIVRGKGRHCSGFP